MKSIVALALCSASLFAYPALAQDGGADPGAPNAYAGASPQAFYDVDSRMARIEAQIQAMGRGGARAMAALRQVKAFEAQQRARHGGELRDWDREAINTRLDRLQAMLGPQRTG